ncbi:interleukin-15 isoform X2 [Channa argus]|uniref:interleukin-15 isoform X2 n=1 Tax=Channa argus TaxID=215402 RepID=UPI003521896F
MLQKCEDHLWKNTKRVQLQSTCNLCRESHKTQVWLCFLIVSFLSISTCSASSLNTKHLQKCLTGLRQRIQKSDAELYTPPFSQICVNSSLKCYMLELKMVLNEERLEGTEVNYIFTFDKDLITTFDGCPACETYPLTNTTVFLEGLNKLLEAINA